MNRNAVELEQTAEPVIVLSKNQIIRKNDLQNDLKHLFFLGNPIIYIQMLTVECDFKSTESPMFT
ncbi:5992_t:CDS:2 [Gigaspora rosea]|nr:5992_t:CDS:2 [Gigaspora rosea]